MWRTAIQPVSGPRDAVSTQPAQAADADEGSEAFAATFFKSPYTTDLRETAQTTINIIARIFDKWIQNKPGDDAEIAIEIKQDEDLWKKTDKFDLLKYNTIRLWPLKQILQAKPTAFTNTAVLQGPMCKVSFVMHHRSHALRSQRRRTSPELGIA